MLLCVSPAFPFTAVREGDGNCRLLAVRAEQSVGLNTVCLEIQVAELQEATFFFLLGRKLIVTPQIVQEGRLCGCFTIYSFSGINTPPLNLLKAALVPFQFIIMYFQSNSYKV